MYDLIEIDPSKDSRWDLFVNSNSCGQIYNTALFKEVLECSCKHIRSKHYCLVNRSNNAITAALPLYIVESWIMGNRLVGIPFATLSDPLVESRDEFEYILEQVFHLERDYKYKRMELILFKQSNLLDCKGLYIQKEYKNHFLNLNITLEEISNNLKRTVRQSIRKAEKNGLILYKANREKDLKKFYEVYLITRKRNGVPVQPYRFILSLWQKLYPKKQLDLFLLYKGKDILGGCILLKYKNRIILEYLATKEKYLYLRPNHFLVWHSIRYAKENGYKIFDFGRTDPQNIGLMRFKASWGTEVKDIFRVTNQIEDKKLQYNGNSFLSKIVRFLCKYLPTPLYTGFSSLCYHHLG